MAAIITAVRRQGFRPVVVYNSNGYDRVETLRHLDDLVDVPAEAVVSPIERLAQAFPGSSLVDE